MSTDDGETGAGAPWPEARDEALAVLRDALLWRLPQARWDEVRRAIEQMTAAATAASPDTLWRATGHLEVCSPVRVATRLGDVPVLPAPGPVRERIAELISALTPESAARPESTARPESAPWPADDPADDPAGMSRGA